MILQHLVWPKTEKKEITELYYHTNTPVTVLKQGLYVPKGTKLAFDTYFNAFSNKTWKKYTSVEEIQIRIMVEGKGNIQLCNEKGTILAEQPFFGNQTITFSIKERKACLYYVALVTEEATVLYKGTVETQEQGKKVQLAVVTCTYNRKEALKRNVCLIQEENNVDVPTIYKKEISKQNLSFLQKNDTSVEKTTFCKEEISKQNLCLVQDKNNIVDRGKEKDETKLYAPIIFKLYVVDNARNIKKEELPEDVILIPNKNTGGAGGFSRGLQEAIQEKGITHIVLMDDDVELEFEALRRNKSFLMYVKEEYEDCFIGGAMFRMDKPYVLHASGEIWNAGRIQSPYQSFDMRTRENVCRITEPIEAKDAYAGWWYCCIPRKHVEEKGYPMPFFLHVDDVEYSLRSGTAPIYLNGIAVWHEEFEDKRSSVMEYYDTRNRLITNAMYLQKKEYLNAILIIAERFCSAVLRYRYEDINLILLALKDYLKGPVWLRNLDAEEYHIQLCKMGYQMRPIKKVKLSSSSKQKSKVKTMLRYIFPAYGKAILPVGALVCNYAGKKEIILLDKSLKTGIKVKKSWKKTFYYLGKIIIEELKLLFLYKKMKNQWKNK